MERQTRWVRAAAPLTHPDTNTPARSTGTDALRSSSAAISTSSGGDRSISSRPLARPAARAAEGGRRSVRPSAAGQTARHPGRRRPTGPRRRAAGCRPATARRRRPLRPAGRRAPRGVPQTSPRRRAGCASSPRTTPRAPRREPGADRGPVRRRKHQADEVPRRRARAATSSRRDPPTGPVAPCASATARAASSSPQRWGSTHTPVGGDRDRRGEAEDVDYYCDTAAGSDRRGAGRTPLQRTARRCGLAVGVADRRDATGLRVITERVRARTGDRRNGATIGRLIMSGRAILGRAPVARALPAPRRRRDRAARRRVRLRRGGGRLLLVPPHPRRPRAMVDRRVAGRAAGTLLGWAEFCGLRIAVAPGVFVPRRRTELLVDLALALPPTRRRGRRPVLRRRGDRAALAAAVRLELHAADVGPVAVRCARRNSSAATFTWATLFEPHPRCCAAGSTSSSPTRPTCPPTRSR